MDFKRLLFAGSASVVILIGGIGLWFIFGFGVISNRGLPQADLPYGSDLRSFAVAGELASNRDASEMYDGSAEVYRSVNASRFVNPPWYAMVMMPLSLVPFPILFPLWSMAGLAALLWALTRMDVARRGLVSFGVLMSVAGILALYFGQNSFFMVAVLTFSLLALESGAGKAAGVSLALLGFKPHLLLGVAVWWLVEHRRYRVAIVSAVAMSFGLVLVSAWWLPGSWARFFETLLEPEGLVSPFFEVTLLSAFRLVTGEHHLLAFALYSLAAVALFAALISVIRSSGASIRLIGAIAIAVSLLVTPHGLPYDWLLLVVSGGLILGEFLFPWRRVLLMGLLLGLALVLNHYLTLNQIDAWGFAIQPAPLALLGVTVWTMRVAHDPASHLAASQPVS